MFSGASKREHWDEKGFDIIDIIDIFGTGLTIGL